MAVAGGARAHHGRPNGPRPEDEDEPGVSLVPPSLVGVKRRQSHPSMGSAPPPLARSFCCFACLCLLGTPTADDDNNPLYTSPHFTPTTPLSCNAAVPICCSHLLFLSTPCNHCTLLGASSLSGALVHPCFMPPAALLPLRRRFRARASCTLYAFRTATTQTVSVDVRIYLSSL